MKILTWSDTNVGKVRKANEDSFVVNKDLNLYLVADGMGGHKGGKKASSMAVSIVEQYIKNHFTDDLTEEQLLKSALQEANRQILTKSMAEDEFSGMGTTFTGLWHHNNLMHLVHVGDSRAYFFRDNKIEQITEDHTWVNEQFKAGYITKQEAEASQYKSVITRSIGFDANLRIDYQQIHVTYGDVFLICSDGLSNLISTPELEQLISANFFSDLPDILSEIALSRGAPDNFTFVICYLSNELPEIKTSK